MIASVILPATFWQSARACMAVPNTARHNATVICVLLFITSLALSVERVNKTLFINQSPFALILMAGF
jgi:hypothetical protein